jgi:O-antigen/teichoic acid export membrane protein
MTADQSTTLGRKTLAGIGWIGAWRMAARTLGFISTLVLARLLFPSDFGVVAMATGFVGAVESLSQFSIEDALIRRVESDTDLHDVAFTLQIARALLTAALIAAAAPLAASWFAEPRLKAVVWVLAGLTAVSGLENIGIVEFHRELKFGVQFQVLLFPRLLQFSATLLVAWLTHSYWALLAGIGTQRVSRLFATYIIHPYRPRLSLSGWQSIAGFSFWLWATGMLSIAWDRYDTFLIGHFFGSSALGLYIVGSQIATLPSAELVLPATSVLMASFAYSQRTGGGAVSNALVLSVGLLLVVMPLAVILSTAAGDVVDILLGRRWLSAVPIVSIMAWSCLASAVRQICGAVLIATGAVRRQFVSVMIVSVVRVFVVYFVARNFSLSAVAAAAVGFSALEALLFVVQVRASGHARIRSALTALLRAVPAGAAAVVIAQQAKTISMYSRLDSSTHLRHLGSMLDLITVGGASILVYAIVLLSLWVALGRPDGPEKLALRLVRNMLPART